MPTLPWTASNSPQQRDGTVGVALIARPLRLSFWTLSAWQDQAALGAAVGREPRRRIMTHFRPRISGSSFVTWTAPASALPITWDEALRRLEKPDTTTADPTGRGDRGIIPAQSRSRKATNGINRSPMRAANHLPITYVGINR
jgi:hypothetical protein